MSTLSKKGTESQVAFGKESSLLAREKLCIGLSIFEMVLTKLRAFLEQDKDVWDKYEEPPEHSVLQVRGLMGLIGFVLSNFCC